MISHCSWPYQKTRYTTLRTIAYSVNLPNHIWIERGCERVEGEWNWSKILCCQENSLLRTRQAKLMHKVCVRKLPDVSGGMGLFMYLKQHEFCFWATVVSQFYFKFCVYCSVCCSTSWWDGRFIYLGLEKTCYKGSNADVMLWEFVRYSICGLRLTKKRWICEDCAQYLAKVYSKSHSPVLLWICDTG